MVSRNTVQKRVIYEALCQLGNHPTADQVFSRVHSDYPSISKTTVYRVLRQLAESGAVLRVGVSGGAEHFDHRAQPHLHIHCIGCGRVDDVQAAPMGDPLEALLDAGGYLVIGAALQYSGLCPGCQKGRDSIGQ